MKHFLNQYIADLNSPETNMLLLCNIKLFDSLTKNIQQILERGSKPKELLRSNEEPSFLSFIH